MKYIILSLLSCNMVDHKNSLDYQFGKWLSSPSPGDEVVISGVSGRFPQCNNVSELSENLLNKRDMITENTVRWSVRHPEIPIRSGPIPNVDKFDAGFFGMHQKQVENADLILKKFIEVSTEAVIDAGLHPVDLENSKTGVFIGFSYSETAHPKCMNMTQPNSFALTGYLKSMIAHRISYFLKLKGPSVVIDTACSSSLNALENAFKAIRSGQCEQALVGGAHLTTHPGLTLQFYRLGVLSTDGVCKVFDEDADGYVRGETIACVFLQKSKNSKRIYAQIVHSKVNTDGYKDNGLLFPSSKVQGRLLKEVYEECGIELNQLSYFEAHGTATKVGDLQEIQAIDNVIAKQRNKPLWVGSVKSNIGHSEPASGFGSIAKVLVAMHTGYIPPNLHFKKAKEGMDAFFEKRLIPVTEKVPLENNAVVGISNFGFGGNNCHLVLRRIFKSKVHYDNHIPKLICVSGRTKEAVEQILEEAIRLKGDLEWIGLIHNVFRKEFPNHLFRGFVIVRESNAPIISIQQYAKKSCPFYVKLGNFQKTYNFCAKYLINVPLFRDKLKNFQKIFTKNVNDVNQNYVDNGNVIEAFAVQLSVIELLKALDLSPVVFLEKSLVELLQVYPILKSTLQELQYNSGTYINSDSIVFDLSDTNPDLVDFDTMLKIVGRLFQDGYNPHLQKIYDIIEYPVSSETPIISSLVKWNYKKSWPMDYHTCFDNTAKNVVEINLDENEYEYIKGHVIDGRNLFPATGYLYMVWQIFAEQQMLQTSNFPVIFRHCKFIKATTITSSKLTFAITIQQGNGNFEIVTNNSTVVTGQIVCLKDVTQFHTDCVKPKFIGENQKHFLDSDEIYKELNLRGYNYTGLFRGLKKSNLEATQGLIEWKNNWVTFIDTILQLKILQTDTRVLYVPTEIREMVLDPFELQQVVESTNGETNIPVVADNTCNIIKSAGVEIHGLLARPIAKKLPIEPVLEKYEFIPNYTSLDLIRSVTINTQIILEESLEDDIKAIELVDEFTNLDHTWYMPLMYNALEKIPVVSPDLTISTKRNIDEITGVKIEFVPLTFKNDVLLIVASKIFQRPKLLTQVFSCLKKNGFALSRENKNFTLKNIDGITILTEHTLHNEKLILFKKSDNSYTNQYIEISSSSFEWIPQLQKLIKNPSSVILYCQNKQPSGILGFINCLRREVKAQKIKCFFMMDDAPEFDPLNQFYEQQIEQNQAINVYKDTKWGTYRHLLLEEASSDLKEHSRVIVTSKGDLSSVRWFEARLNYPNEQENIIHTYYSAVNFRDVMVATARITISVDRLTDENLEGLEYSGRDLKGNRVMGMVTGGAFSNIITSDPNLRWPVPTFWSLEDAATVPCVYSTVIYALLMRISLKPGTSILIHSATGGIGIAALNVALYHGCNVFVTVGSSEKKDYLKINFPQIADTHIGSSRDNSFQEMIQKHTNGRGVDIVLNSLSEEKLHNSIRCLAQGGILMEIGKFDLINNNKLNLILLEKNASYHGVMLDHVMENTNTIKAQISEKILKGIKAGYVKTLPRKVFNYNEVETAFRYMTTGKHIGKILIKLREEENEEIVKPTKHLRTAFPRFYCDPKKSYIIIGGLGGFGLELADWMVLRGARKLILTSRTGVQSGYQTQRIKIWSSYGAYVHVSTIDTSTKSGCLNLIKEASHIGPVDGIFNLAVILEDALFEDQNEEKFNTSFTPKALTTKFMDEITRDLCPNLSHFVVFSSVSCGRGNVGQTNYGMANSVMEQICEKRKRDGFSGLAIQWGAVGDVGLVAKMQKENKELVIGGTLQQKISSCLNVMDQFLNQTNPIVSSMVVAKKHDKTTGKTPLEVVVKIIGIRNTKTVSQQATLAELGMDSIMGTEIIQILEKDFGIYLTSKEVRTLTLSKLLEMGTETCQENKNNNKIFEGTNLLIRHLPDCSTVDFPFVEFGNPSKNNITVFVFPGIEGVFPSLELIVKNLNTKVLGVQYTFKNTENNIETIARKIYPHIKNRLCTEKCFSFIGYSFGVMVALEVASLLENQNYVGKIAAIDGSPEYTSETVKQYTHDGPESEFETILMFNVVGLFAPMEILSKHKEKLINCKNFDQRVDLSLSLMPPELIKKHGIKHEHARILYERFKSVKNYSFTKDKLKSLIRLYKATFTMIRNVEDDYSLSKYCTEPVTIQTVEGDHETMLKQNILVEDLKNFFEISV